MWFLINIIVLFFVSLGAQAQTNPFNVTLTLEKHVDENGEKQTIKVVVLSESKNKEKYYLTIDLPASSIKNIEEKKSYTGSIEPLDSDSFFIDIEPVGEAKAQIKTSIYKYVNDKNIDAANVRNQLFDCSVVKDDNDKYLVYISNNVSNQNSPSIIVGSEVLELNPTEAVTDSKIVINEASRRNNSLRYFLFLLSFFVIGHLIYRIVRED